MSRRIRFADAAGTAAKGGAQRAGGSTGDEYDNGKSSSLVGRELMAKHIEQKSNPSLSTKLKAIYCAPQIAILPVTTLLSIFGTAFYEHLGANVQYIAFFATVTRSMDLILEPTMSYMSDSFRGPHGRRRPFCFVGCWLYGLMLVLLLSPPSGMGNFNLAMWFGLTSMGFYMSNSFTVIPYESLGPELSHSYNDRTKLYFISTLFELGGSVFVLLLSTIFLYGADASGSASSCDNTSCYSPTGNSQSCLRSFVDNMHTNYHIFDVYNSTYNSVESTGNAALSNICTYQNGTSYIDPAQLFHPSQCSIAYPLTPYTNDTGLINDHSPWWTGEYIANLNVAEHGWQERNIQCLRSYCQCVIDCSDSCVLDGERNQYSSLAYVIALFFIASMCLMTYRIRERSQSADATKKLPYPSSPVASVMSALKNSAFTKLLPTYICDSVSYSLITTTMLYFVTYIIQPEKQSRSQGHSFDCNNGVAITGEESDSWECSSTSVLGAILSVMLTSAFCTSPLWYYVAISRGKRFMWLAWSFLLLFSLFFLFIVGKGDIYLAIGLACIPGASLGGKFIASSILADVIEYDEYLSGQRNEATYVMLRSFFPKLVSVPASTIPLVVVSILEPYSQSMTNALYVMMIIVPAFLTLISLFYKLNFSLRYKAQVDLISEGISLHVIGIPSLDPISGVEYLRTNFSRIQNMKLDVLNHFPSVRDANDLRLATEGNNRLVSVALLIDRTKNQSATIFLLTAASLTGLILTWTFFSSIELTIYPIMLSVIFTTSILLLVFSLLRYRAACKMKTSEYAMDVLLLSKVVSIRKLYEKISSTPVVDIVGINDSRQMMRKRLSAGLGMEIPSEYDSDDRTKSNKNKADIELTDSDDSDDARPDETAKQRRLRKLATEKRADNVVNHWKKIFNNHHGDLATKEGEVKVKSTEEHSQKQFQTFFDAPYVDVLRGINEAISSNVPLTKTYENILKNICNKDEFEKNHPLVGQADGKTESSNSEELPTLWDQQTYMYVQNNAKVLAARSEAEQLQDIENSKNNGAEDNSKGNYTHHDDDDSSSSSSNSSESD